jgi:hypothetical protein
MRNTAGEVSQKKIILNLGVFHGDLKEVPTRR